MKKPLDNYFVPWIKPLKMYISSHIELAWKKPKLARMMSNENPIEPSEKVKKTIIKYASIANRYPDQGLLLRGEIAKLNHLPGPENVVLGNGSSEIYDMIFRSFLLPGEIVIQHTPCFGIYKLRTEVLGGEIVSVPMVYKNKKLLFDAAGILKKITSKTKIIVIANPNNPTGNFMPVSDFRKLAQTGIPFVIDEAYIEYSGLSKSQIPLIKKYPNVIITRTFSKAYGLAGLRIGYLLANKKVAEKIAATLLPWNVGTVSMWAALSALRDKKSLSKRVNFNNQQLRFIEKSLLDIPGLIVFPSHANYILFDTGPLNVKGQEVIDFARGKGIILRGVSDMYGSSGWFRVTVGLEKENKLFVKTIRDFFSQKSRYN